MDPSTVQLATFALALVNVLVLPALIALGKHLWSVNDRLTRIELTLQQHIDQEDRREARK